MADALHDLPPHLEVKASLIPNAGMGLFARRDLRDGRRIGKYRGTTYYKRSSSDYVEESHKPYLMDTIEGGFIDGYQLNNHMRWANHSRTPNAYAHLENDGAVFFITLRDIRAGEEITIDYGYDPTKPEIPRCRHCHTATVLSSWLNLSETNRICLVCMLLHKKL